MDLELSDDQELFRETTRAFLESETPLTRVRELAAVAAGFEREWWRRGAELGWTLEDNQSINRTIAAVGAERYKTYRIYEKAIGGAGS